MKKIVIGDIVSRAWDLAVKHWPIFVLLSLITSLVSQFGATVDPNLLTGLGQNPDPQAIAEALREAMVINYPMLIIGILLSIYLGFVVYRMLYNAITTGRPYTSMGEAFKVDFNQLAIFFCVDLVFGLAVGFGTLFCIIPGIFLAVRWMFAPLIAATEGTDFVESFRRSWQATSGNFWNLLLLGIVSIGIAILGLCACCVGVFFADVIIDFMLVLAYLELKPQQPTFDDQTISEDNNTPSDFVEVQ